MNLRQIADRLNLRHLTESLDRKLDAEVTGGHASDLLSDVLSNAPVGGVAVTIQVHLNTIAVALHARLAGVILSAGRLPEQEVIDRAEEEGVPLFVSEEPTFDVVGKLYDLGLRGGKRG